jgi:hypothetical protein
VPKQNIPGSNDPAIYMPVIIRYVQELKQEIEWYQEQIIISNNNYIEVIDHREK